MSHPARSAPGSHRFLWAAPAWRTLVEAWLLGLGIIFIFSRLVGQVAVVSFASGLPALCGVCGVWAVLRARVPVLRPRDQIAWELLMSAALGVTMLSLRLPASGLGVDEAWHANWADLGAALFLLGTGVGYAFCRVAVRLWLRWGEMRRQRLVWSLTHAHLMLLFLVGLVGLVAVAVVIRAPRLIPLSDGVPPDPVAALLTQLIVWVVPSLTWLAAYSVAAVVFGLPPLALASYIVARSTIRRLERLVTAASAMRSGEYSARVAVTGEDEVAQLQAAFNTMAETLEQNVSELEQQREQGSRPAGVTQNPDRKRLARAANARDNRTRPARDIGREAGSRRRERRRRGSNPFSARCGSDARRGAAAAIVDRRSLHRRPG